MNIKMGDLVIRKNGTNDLLFQVTGFDGEYVVLKGIRIPIFTICNNNELIKISKNRYKFYSGLRIVK